MIDSLISAWNSINTSIGLIKTWNDRQDLAIAVILMDLAIADNDFCEIEQDFIRKVLVDELELSKDKAHDLMVMANEIVKLNTSVDDLIEFFNNKASHEDKEKAIKFMNKMKNLDMKNSSIEKRKIEEYKMIFGLKF